MKPFTSLAIVAALLLFSSCKKQSDHTCKCDGGFTGGGSTNTIKARTIVKARSECKAMDNGTDVYDGLYNCRLVP